MINERVAALYEAVRNASATDDDIARLYATVKQQRHTRARVVAETLAALGPLRDDLDLDAATDLLWLLKDPALYTELVGDRGWPAERYQAWLARVMQASLLQRELAARQARSHPRRTHSVANPGLRPPHAERRSARRGCVRSWAH